MGRASTAVDIPYIEMKSFLARDEGYPEKAVLS